MTPVQLLRRHSFAFFLALALVLARVAMPFAAVQAASLQGVQLAEICTVYGVAKIVVDGGAQGEGSHAPSQNGSQHGSHDCPLGSLASLAPALADAGAVAPAPLVANTDSRERLHENSTRDPQARWAALKHHGPPSALA